jgi:5'-nucleotidase
VGEVFVTAPDREQSGVGSALTLHAPVKVRSVPPQAYLGADHVAPHAIAAYAIEGTPGDSCLLGLEQLVKSVDLVVSGINTGSNLGWDIMVSGTVGAALQGYLRGFPTIAISVGSVQSPRFDGAASLLQLIAGQMARQSTTTPFFLNINVPSVALEQINGLQVTRLGGRSYGESVRPEGTGHQQRYWISRNRPIQADNGEGTDMWALQNNRISITPLQLSLSNHDQMPEIESLLADLPQQLLKRQD